MTDKKEWSETEKMIRAWVAGAVADGWVRTATHQHESVEQAMTLKHPEGFLAQVTLRSAEKAFRVWGPDGLCLPLPQGPYDFSLGPYDLVVLREAMTRCPECGAFPVETIRVGFANRCCRECAPALRAQMEQPGWTS